MMHAQRLTIEDLQNLCDSRAEETLVLEFKSCNELRVGSPLLDRSRNETPRTSEHVLEELTKDVSAFLNATGGTIIYGVKEKKSRADQLDREHAFKQSDGLYPERILQWLRAHIQPSPTVNVYRVIETPDDPNSPWYIVIEISQGQQAYMAKDHRFYKRVGNIATAMEQYEVVDVMNRTRSAVLNLQIGVREKPQDLPMYLAQAILKLDIAVTTTNFIASEYGALKLIITSPLEFKPSTHRVFISESHFESEVRLLLNNQEGAPFANSMMTRWGANIGNVIFPGDRYNFYSNPISIKIPTINFIPNPTYLIQAELFTINNQSKQLLYAIQQNSTGDWFDVFEVHPENYDEVIASFWKTYHVAREKFKNS